MGTSSGAVRPPLTAVEIIEVAPRDGLQNEKQLLTTAAKLELIERAYEAGARRIEVTSFVHPERVPQMADAEAVVAGLTPHDDVVYAALVLNERGYDRALAAGIREVNTVVITTETFSRRNQGMSVAEAVEVVSRIRARASADSIRVTVTISAAFGCPFEGEVPLDTLNRVATQVAAIDADEVVLADTIGVAVPSDVEERIALVREIGASRHAAGALPQHPQHGRRERGRSGSLRRDRDRCLAGRDRRLPLRPRRDRERRHRGPRLRARANGVRDGLRPRALDRECPLDRRRARDRAAGDGRPGRRIPRSTVAGPNERASGFASAA